MKETINYILLALDPYDYSTYAGNCAIVFDQATYFRMVGMVIGAIRQHPEMEPLDAVVLVSGLPLNNEGEMPVQMQPSTAVATSTCGGCGGGKVL